MKSAALLVRGLCLSGLLVSPFLSTSAWAAEAAAPAASAPAKPDLTAGAAKSNAVCVACHANDGSRGSPANPILQGQHPEYLVKQLTEFKAGKRPSPIMQGIAATLTPDDMRNVAAFYASKSPKTGFAKDKNLAELGEKIWRGGIADRNIPACAGCHGPNGMGIPVQYPRLAGQHADYTVAQLSAFRAGTRKNGPAMMTIAAKMSDQEIKAVSDYLAGAR